MWRSASSKPAIELVSWARRQFHCGQLTHDCVPGLDPPSSLLVLPRPFMLNDLVCALNAKKQFSFMACGTRNTKTSSRAENKRMRICFNWCPTDWRYTRCCSSSLAWAACYGICRISSSIYEDTLQHSSFSVAYRFICHSEYIQKSIFLI